ncbi:hypothetical protein GIB67_039486, partial [Kingdonia uniflora]
MASLFSTDIFEWAQLLESIKSHPKMWEPELETVSMMLLGPIKKYDTAKVLTPHYDLNIAAYDNYGKLYLSPLFALSIGNILKQSKIAMKSAKLDIHARLMKMYKDVTQWWFHEIIIVKCLQ